ncbi:MAG TPA: glycosyltransferase [Candidatus Brocadiia bacterium]|nr:glycosyltransferase [Candidatus Brocadiales bacterium]
MALKRCVKLFIALAVFLFSIPLSLILYITIFISDILANLTSNQNSKLKTQNSKLKTQASIIIVNWNGRELLEECLPSVVAAVEYDNQNHEIIVVDNGSTDESVSFLENQFPQVKVIALDRNYGFGEGNNIGVKSASREIVVLLNNDMAVDRNFLRPLLNGFDLSSAEGFTDADVFAVSSQIFLQDPNKRREETGKTSVKFRFGAFEYFHENVSENLRSGYYPTYWAGGGSSAFDKRKFLTLGGFDNLFSPCYVEDTDISHLAWKHGWRILFAPESKVYHKHRASSAKRFGENYIDVIVKKNIYLFVWKNITDHLLLLNYFLFLPARLAYFTFKSKGFSAILSFILALGQFPSALTRRTKNIRRASALSGQCALTDREVLDVSTNISLYRERYMPRKKHEKGIRLKILFVTAYLPHVGIHAGGGRMFKVIEILARRHDITLISFLESEDEKKYIPEIEKHCVSVKTLLRRPTPRKNVINTIPGAVDEFWSEEMSRLIKETMTETDFNIVQFEYTQMAQYAPGTNRIFKILTDHEVALFSYYIAFKQEQNLFSKLELYYKWMKAMKWEVDICDKFDKVICVTHEDAAELNNYLIDKEAEVINTGVDASFFSSNTPLSLRGEAEVVPEADSPWRTTSLEEPNTLLFVGSFRHSPNVDGVIYFSNEILPLIKKSVPDVRFYVVGSYPPPDIKNLAHETNIIVTGFVKDLRPYLERSSVFVVPIRLGCGIRGKILEAWAMEKPVVATPLACAGLDAIHMENVLISKTPEHFASDTVRLLKDPQLRRRLGKNGRNMVEKKYDWEIIGKKMLEMYDNIGDR